MGLEKKKGKKEKGPRRTAHGFCKNGDIKGSSKTKQQKGQWSSKRKAPKKITRGSNAPKKNLGQAGAGFPGGAVGNDKNEKKKKSFKGKRGGEKAFVGEGQIKNTGLREASTRRKGGSPGF